MKDQAYMLPIPIGEYFALLFIIIMALATISAMTYFLFYDIGMFLTSMFLFAVVFLLDGLGI